MAAKSSIFDRVKALLKGGSRGASVHVFKWLDAQITKVGAVSPQDVLKDKTRFTPDIFIGKMFMFLYDPKYKKTLPYYDKFPLIIPIDIYEDGFLGLNLHYLPPKYRIVLMDKLIEYTNNDKFDKTTKFKLTYTLLKHASKMKEIEPCIKRYLQSHVASRFVPIDAQDWEIAVLLPVERFAKASKETVWKESLGKVKR